MYQKIKSFNGPINHALLECGHALKINPVTANMDRKQWCDECQRLNQNAISSNQRDAHEVDDVPLKPHMSFQRILQQMLKVHESKNSDYSVANNKFSNFEQAAVISSWFDDPVDRVFATLIGVKLSRLAQVRRKGEALNESAADTHLDLDNYAVLWHEYNEAQFIAKQTKLQVKEPNQGAVPIRTTQTDRPV